MLNLPVFKSLNPLFDNLSNIVCIIDTEDKLIYANKAAYTACQECTGELIGSSYQQFPLLNTANFRKALRKIKAEGGTIQFEDFEGKDELRNVLWTVLWNEPEQVIYVAGKCILPKENSRKHNPAGKTKEQTINLFPVLEQLTDGFALVDYKGTVLYWNQEAATITGFTKNQLENKSLWETIPFIINSDFYSIFNNLTPASSPVHIERYFTKESKWLEINIYPSAKNVFFFFRDVTERNKAEEELKHLSLIAKETMNVVFITGLDKKIIWINTAFTQQTGYTTEEAIGQYAKDLLSGPETNEAVVQQIAALMEKRDTFKLEVLNYKKNGVKYWAEIYCQPMYNKKGEAEGFFFIATDITERKRNEEELYKLSLVARKTNNAVILTNTRQQITWVNDAFTRNTGYSLEEALGKVPSQLLQGSKTDAATAKYMREQLAKGEDFHAEVISHKKNGEAFWTSVNCQPIYDENGILQEFFSIETDITERKELQQQLDKEKVRRQKSITAAVIKAQEQERAQVGQELHDNINQVLTTVKLYNDLVLKDVGNKEELLTKSISYLQNSIDEIRAISTRLAAPTLGNINIRETLKELAESIVLTNKLQVKLDFKGIENLDIHKELHIAAYRIIQEHMTNILKHSGATHVEMCLDKKEKFLYIEIRDNGKGYNVREKRKGIGIINMVSRAENANGKLKIESAPGEGCVLQVWLPLQEGEN